MVKSFHEPKLKQSVNDLFAIHSSCTAVANVLNVLVSVDNLTVILKIKQVEQST